MARKIVNWGRGRLRKHESLSSFLAKFSRVNGLRLEHARRFLCMFLELDSWTEILNHKKHISALSRLLDEPYGVVASMDGRRFDISQALRPDYPSTAVGTSSFCRYCPDCLASQFHSVFHQTRYLVRCPFHGTALITSPSLRDRNKYDCCAAILNDLYSELHDVWPSSPRTCSADLINRIDNQPSLSQYKQYAVSVRAIWAQKLRSPLLFESVNPVFGDWAVGNWLVETLGLAESTLPMSQEVKSLVSPIAAMEETVTDFGSAAVADLERVLSKVTFSDLHQIYHRWWAWSGYARIWSKPLAEVTGELTRKGNACGCTWRWHQYRGWQIGGGDENGLCPHAFLANHLATFWGGFTVNTHWRRIGEMLKHYQARLCAFQALGIVTLHDLPNEWTFPLDIGKAVQWHFSDELMGLLQTILRTELEMRLDTSTDALTVIGNGISPNEVSVCKHILMLRREKSTIKLNCWRPQSSSRRFFNGEI